VDFVGSKVALFCGKAILACQRDDRPDLPWPGMWDLPGGGREGNETPEACLLRELHEEFGLTLDRKRLVWRRVFPSILDASRLSVFFGGHLSLAEIATIRFGPEGKGWALMPVADFLTHATAVPEMQRRAAIAWQLLGAGDGAGPEGLSTSPGD
jgi:8-oxo-dGTP diphosphatase